MFSWIRQKFFRRKHKNATAAHLAMVVGKCSGCGGEIFEGHRYAMLGVSSYRSENAARCAELLAATQQEEWEKVLSIVDFVVEDDCLEIFLLECTLSNSAIIVQCTNPFDLYENGQLLSAKVISAESQIRLKGCISDALWRLCE